MITRVRGERAGERRRVPRAPRRFPQWDVAIVGAGASGTLTAVHLLRRGGARITLIDPSRAGRGVAYSTTDEQHLLNVPACTMSALEDDPDDFLDWCRGHGVAAAPEDFLPRRLYGLYLQDLLLRFGEPACLRVVRERVETLVESPRGDGVSLTLSGGRVIAADTAVLALGNPPPRPLEGVPLACSAALVHDPWAPGAMRRAHAARRVVIVGTGLSAVDVALSVTAANPHARVSAVSRHGWLPRAHVSGAPPRRRALSLEPGDSLEQILAVVARELTARPASWREVVEGLRPHAAGLWQALEPRERSRFERELRPYWEIHRHRLAPAVASRLDELQASARLTVHAGGVRSLTARSGDRVCVELVDGLSLDADLLVNATGPSRVLCGSPNALLQRLLLSARACPDALGIGIATSPDGALIDREGHVSQRCFTLGPPRRGELFESTAIPEIRQQAARLARLLSPTSAQRERASSAIASNAASGFSGS